MKFNKFDSVQSFISVLDDILNYHLPHYLDECCFLSVSDVNNDLFDVKLHFECDDEERNFLIQFINKYHFDYLLHYDVDYSLNCDSKYHYFDFYCIFFNLDLSTCGQICILFNDLISYLESNEVI